MMNLLCHPPKKKVQLFSLVFSLLFIPLFAYADIISFLTEINVSLWTLIIYAFLLIPVLFILYIFLQVLITVVNALEIFINMLVVILKKYVAFCIFIEEKATKKPSKYRDYLNKM